MSQFSGGGHSTTFLKSQIYEGVVFVSDGILSAVVLLDTQLYIFLHIAHPVLPLPPLHLTKQLKVSSINFVIFKVQGTTPA